MRSTPATIAMKAGKKGSEAPSEPLKLANASEDTSDNDSGSASDKASETAGEIRGLEDDSEHTVRKLEKKRRTQGPARKPQESQYSGIVYVGRLPHGFHERELTKYFAQFGDLKEVRLARNKRTGRSRHYAFLEFANPDDARVAQDTMHNYLVMGRLLQVRQMPQGSSIEKLYKYRARHHSFASSAKPTQELSDRAAARHAARLAKLRALGLDFDY